MKDAYQKIYFIFCRDANKILKYTEEMIALQHAAGSFPSSGWLIKPVLICNLILQKYFIISHFYHFSKII